MSPQIGDTAPDFTLADTDKTPVTLSSFRGEKSVTLVFIPFAFTAPCEGELCEVRDNLSTFENADNQVIVITCDRHPTLAEWKKQQGVGFPMLSDGWPHGAVTSAYGLFNEDLGVAKRATVMIDKGGKIVDVYDTGAITETRNMDNYTDALSKL